MRTLGKWAAPVGALGIALIVGVFLLGLVTNTRTDMLLLLGALGVVCVAFYIITRPRDSKRQSSHVRIASEGINVLVFAVVFIAIIAAINFIIDRQFSQRLDLTANKQFTLSQQTMQVLDTLTEPVKVTGFFTPATLHLRQQAEQLLREYQNHSNTILVEYVDPDENPALAQKYDNALPGTVVFESTNPANPRTEKLYDPYDENGFTNAILKVTQTRQPAVYFTAGHGEYSPLDFDTGGMGAVGDFLKAVNYKVESLNLATVSDTLPADTSAIVIAGPTTKFSPENDKLLKDYLDKGGRVLLMAEPNTDIGLTETLGAWGIGLENNLILDPGLNYRGDAPVPVFVSFPNSPLTENLRTLGVFMPGARAIKTSSVEGKMPTPLLTTTDKACVKTDFEKLAQAGQLECAETDTKGSFVAGVALEGAGVGGAGGDARSRLVVLGNATFATNRWMNHQDALGNQQFFENIINWLAGQEQLIAVPPRDPNLRPLAVMTENEINLVLWTSVVLVPLAALLIGSLLWWRRR